MGQSPHHLLSLFPVELPVARHVKRPHELGELSREDQTPQSRVLVHEACVACPLYSTPALQHINCGAARFRSCRPHLCPVEPLVTVGIEEGNELQGHAPRRLFIAHGGGRRHLCFLQSCAFLSPHRSLLSLLDPSKPLLLPRHPTSHP